MIDLKYFNILNILSIFLIWSIFAILRYDKKTNEISTRMFRRIYGLYFYSFMELEIKNYFNMQKRKNLLFFH